MKNLVCLLIILAFAELANAQWEPDVRLTNATGNSYATLNNTKSIAVNGNVIHTVWYDERDGNYEIYYKRSLDNGTSWGADIRLTDNSAGSWFPSIACNGNFVHIVWRESRDANYEIYYKRSTDGGTTWGNDTRLTNNAEYSEMPCISVYGNILHLIWSDYRDGNYEIYYKHSTDNGVNWGLDTRLTNNNANSYEPSIAASGNYVHTVWRDERNGNLEIYYKRSTDGGVIWGTDTRLTNNIADSWTPSIALSDSLVYVVWEDWREGNAEIFFKRSTNVGIIWESDTRLTNFTANSEYPSIAVSGSLVHLVWQDNRDGINAEIYYKRSSDYGINWGTDTRLTYNSENSVYPTIACFGMNLHVVWTDYRDFNSEIYYKRNRTGNVGIQNISSEIPSSYSLGQNYPNPFNPRTKISFQLPAVSEVLIKVYDVMGREVETLVNERLQPGTYETTFDATGYPSGAYFYRIETENFTDVKRMVIVK